MLHSSLSFFNKKNVVWEETPFVESVSRNTTDIWLIPVSDDVLLLDNFYALLNDEELKKASGYRLGHDRQRFITSRGSLKVLAAKYLHQQPGEIQFSANADKKPFLLNTGNEPLEFNVSHSGDYILIAFGTTAVGVDVEKINISFSYKEIIQSAFSSKEIEYVQESDQPALVFFLLWTRKEALLKATGKGLTDDLPLIPSLDGTHTLDAGIINSYADWNICSFDVDEQYIGSVAFKPGAEDLRFFTIAHAGLMM